MLYEVTGTGKMLLFQDGLVIPGTWTKATPATRTKFLATTGKEVQLNRGPIWIELIPSGNQVSFPQ